MTRPRRPRHPDEDDVRIRPGRGTRPRSKERPQHLDAVIGDVVTVDRGRYTSLLDGREVVAMTARELGRRAVVVGDRVALVGDVSGGPDSLARIVRVEPRTSALRRTADDTDPVERVIVANADQLAVVLALANPEPRTRLIDRCLVAAYDARLDPRTSGFTEDYLIPFGITSMLDVPVRRLGQTAGVICFEHIGPPRTWSVEDENFATSISDLVAMAIDGTERRQTDELDVVTRCLTSLHASSARRPQLTPHRCGGG